LCQCVKIVYNTDTLFYEFVCEMFAYHNVLTTRDRKIR
jgi:hypothetical protein